MNKLLNQILLSLSEIPDERQKEKEAIKVFRSIQSEINWEQFLQEIRRSIEKIERKRLKKIRDDEFLILLALIYSWLISFLKESSNQEQPKLKIKLQ